jgi:hypothetical protein
MLWCVLQCAGRDPEHLWTDEDYPLQSIECLSVDVMESIKTVRLCGTSPCVCVCVCVCVCLQQRAQGEGGECVYVGILKP